MKDFKVFASCHNHSTFSDGENTPELLVRIAKCMGHGGIILTDHDTIAGYPFIKKAAEDTGLLTMLGCEFTTYHTTKDGKTVGVHLLGYDFDLENEEIKKFINWGSGIQTERSHLLFDWALERGSIRLGVNWEDVIADHPHHNYICNNEIFASYLKRDIYKASEYDAFCAENFAHNLGYDDKIAEIIGKSYRDIHTGDVVKAILSAGGVPIIAHPARFANISDELYDLGVLGFETRHASMNEESHKFYENYCLEHGLYRTGGSDHENVLGGLLSFGERYASPYEFSGVDEDRFMELYERRLG